MLSDFMSYKPSYLNFNKSTYAWKPDIDYRAHPELYRVGKGEQEVLICEPYKTQIGQFWRFKTVEIARKSSDKIYTMFLQYLESNDFVAADMARKYLQMGFTRARRYANYKGGKKYDQDNGYRQMERGTGTSEKAAAADVFFKAWKAAEAEPRYQQLKSNWPKIQVIKL